MDIATFTGILRTHLGASKADEKTTRAIYAAIAKTGTW